MQIIVAVSESYFIIKYDCDIENKQSRIKTMFSRVQFQCYVGQTLVAVVAESSHNCCKVRQGSSSNPSIGPCSDPSLDSWMLDTKQGLSAVTKMKNASLFTHWKVIRKSNAIASNLSISQYKIVYYCDAKWNCGVLKIILFPLLYL